MSAHIAIAAAVVRTTLIATTAHVAPIARVATLATLATLALIAACSRTTTRADGGPPRTPLAYRVPLGLGAARAVAVVSDRAGALVQVFSRAHNSTESAPALSLARLPVVLAALRTGRLAPSETYACTGFRCVATHGPVTPVQGLALPCLAFVDDLARRIGAPAIGAAFAVLGVTPPAIADDADARATFATRGTGWSLSARDALALARALVQRPAPWFSVIDDAAMQPAVRAAPLRGLLASDDASAWFVGYLPRPDAVTFAVHATECAERCDVAVVSIATWAVARALPGAVPGTMPGTMPGAVPRAGSVPLRNTPRGAPSPRRP